MTDLLKVALNAILKNKKAAYLFFYLISKLKIFQE
jgi:hypothetical protein